MTVQPQLLRGKVALITGGTGRIGRAVVQSLSRAGARCVIHYYANESRAQQIAEEISLELPRAELIRGDFMDPAAPISVVNSAIEVCSGLDILVNCAAIKAGVARETGMPMQPEWDRVLSVNLRAALLCTETAAPALASRMGSVVNVSSTAAHRPLRGNHEYVASKSALEGITRSLAISLAPKVRVNAVAPGLIEEPNGTGQSWKRSYINRIPAGRLGTPADVAEVVLFLVSAAQYVNGQTLIVDGGMLIAG